MADYQGTAGDDDITGTTGGDLFDMSQGGDDTVFGNGGHDVIYFGAALTAADQIDGGTTGGHNRLEATLVLNGDYSAGLVFAATTMVNIERILLEKGHDYNLTLDDANVSTELKVHAKLAGSDSLTFDGSAETNGRYDITSTAGHSIIIGGAGGDVFHLQGSERLDVHGGGGGDQFYVGGKFGMEDRIAGDDGFDSAIFDVGYAKTLTLTSSMLSGVERVDFSPRGGPGSYNVVTTDDLVAAGGVLTVASSGAQNFTFDGSAETDGAFQIQTSSQNSDVTVGRGNDQLWNGSGTAVYHLELGGNDSVSAAGTSCTVYMAASLTADDRIDGATVVLDGDYSSGLAFNATTLDSVFLLLTAGHSYSFTAADGGTGISVGGGGLGADDSLTFDGSAEATAGFGLFGGAGTDVLIGGAGANVLYGGGGHDTLRGGIGSDRLSGGGGGDIVDGGSAGQDNFIFGGASEASGIHFDTIVGFNALRDVFTVPEKVKAIDPTVMQGELDNMHGSGLFNQDLANAMDASHLRAFHAALFTPDSGSLAGTTFLIVDQNGIAGYQTGDDLVLELDSASALDSLNTRNFHST